MPPLSRSILCLLLGAAFATAWADDKAVKWTDDFSNPETFPESWVPYGRLADGTWRQGIEGHWKNGTAFARPEWWAIEDGALRGQNFPDEDHPAGLSRQGRLPHKDGQKGLRVSLKVKVSPTSIALIRVRGNSVGKFSPQATDSHLTVLNVSANQLKLWNASRELQEPEQGDSAQRFRRSRAEEEGNADIPAGKWRTVAMAFRGKEVKVLVEGKEALTLMLEADQPLQRFGIEANGDKKTAGIVYFDDITLEPLME